MRFASIQYSKMRLRPGLCPGSCGSLQRSPNPVAVLKGAARRGRGGRKGKGREEGEGKWKGKVGVEKVVGRGGKVSWNRATDWLRPPLSLVAIHSNIHFLVSFLPAR